MHDVPDPDALHRAGRRPRKICYRESEFKGDKYHFCSDHCKDIFDGEPQKYVQAWLPVHQIYQGNCFKPGTDPTAKASTRCWRCLTTTR